MFLIVLNHQAPNNFKNYFLFRFKDIENFNNHWTSKKQAKNQISKLFEDQIYNIVDVQKKKFKLHSVKNMFLLMMIIKDIAQIKISMNSSKNINKLNNLN